MYGCTFVYCNKYAFIVTCLDLQNLSLCGAIYVNCFDKYETNKQLDLYKSF